MATNDRARRGLLRRKYTVPALWPGAIARPRLTARLTEAVGAGRHVALVAGTGFGKSTLLTEWASRQPTAWVSLDPDDAAPAAFLAYMIAAIEGVLPGFATSAGEDLGEATSREAALSALGCLIADLEEQVERPFAIVLDDLHLAASPTVDALVERMVRYLPEPARLVVASRHEPRWGLQGLAARRVVERLDESALAFDEAELTALDPTADPLAVLEATGGWPAGMAMTDAAREAYLEEQVFRDLTPAVREFLLRASLIDAFDGPLAEAAFGAAPDPARDDELVRLHLVTRLGPGTLSVIPPLRAWLRRRFELEVPQQEQLRLLVALGEALMARGQVATALSLWSAGGLAGRAADLLVAIAPGWLRQGAIGALTAALGAIAPSVERPELAWLAGELARRAGDFDRAEEAYGRAETLSAGDRGGIARARLGRALSAASAGRVEVARALLAEARPDLPDDPAVDLDVENLTGGLALFSGDTATARARFEAALRRARALADGYAEARAMHNLGVCHTRLGDLDRALACYDAALAAVPAGGAAIAMTPVNRALVLVELGRAAEGLEAARQALASTRRLEQATEEGYALRTLGLAQRALGNAAAAGEAFREAEQLGRRMNDALGQAFSLACQAELELDAQGVAAAERLIAEAEAALGGAAAAAGYVELRHVRARLASARGEDVSAWRAELSARADLPSYRRMLDELAGPVAAPVAPPAPDLVVRCFGGLEVSLQGRPVIRKDWQSARTRALFVYLLHHPAGAGRQRLLEAIYPNEDPGDSTLYMTLGRLRRALEPELAQGRPSRWVLRRDGVYRFDRLGSYALDTEAFTRAIAAARAASGPAAAAAYQAALDLYTGDFFPECDFAWAVALRLDFRELALSACRALLDLLPASGATETIRRALVIDPLSEEFNREMILRHLEAGEPRLAREHLRLVRQRYGEMLDAEPPADLNTLVGEET